MLPLRRRLPPLPLPLLQDPIHPTAACHNCQHPLLRDPCRSTVAFRCCFATASAIFSRRYLPLLFCRFSARPSGLPCCTESQIYTPEENAAYWQTRPVAVVRRTMQISAALGSWLMEGRLTNRGASAQALTDIQADKLRHLLTELGPAFVKIGQAVSSRRVCIPCCTSRSLHAAALGVQPWCCSYLSAPAPSVCRAILHPTHPRIYPLCRCSPDVAPPEFLRELEKLQDQIPPFNNDRVRRWRPPPGVW